jgi:hypothetical protein
MSTQPEKTGQEAVASSELLPCPFCGGPAKMRRSWKFPFGGWEYDVFCLRGCTSPFDFFDTREECAKLWNTRWHGNVRTDAQRKEL